MSFFDTTVSNKILLVTNSSNQIISHLVVSWTVLQKVSKSSLLWLSSHSNILVDIDTMDNVLSGMIVLLINLHNGSQNLTFRLHANACWHLVLDTRRSYLNFRPPSLVFDRGCCHFYNLCLRGGILSSKCSRVKGSLYNTHLSRFMRLMFFLATWWAYRHIKRFFRLNLIRRCCLEVLVIFPLFWKFIGIVNNPRIRRGGALSTGQWEANWRREPSLLDDN